MSGFRSLSIMAQAKAVGLILLLAFASAVESGKPDLYYFPASPPSRMALMTARVLATDINVKILDVSKGEQFTPEYLKLNPQHTVPALDDNGFTMSESRAIAGYLASISPNGEKLYPKDPKKRALVDQMMYFDLDKLYSRTLKFFVVDPDATPMVLGGPFNQRKGELLDAAFAMLDEYLTRNVWAAGDDMTIADIALLTTVSMAEGCGYVVSKYPKVNQWLAKMKASIPDYKTNNEDGLLMWINANQKKLNHT